MTNGLVLVRRRAARAPPAAHSHLEGAAARSADIRAVLLDHAHPDHTGAAAAHAAGADVWVHERDAAALAGGARAAKQAGQARALAAPIPHPPARDAARHRVTSPAGGLHGLKGRRPADHGR